MKISKYWKIVEFRKISIKMKNCKTFYETETANRLQEIIQPPQLPIPLDKILLRLWNKNLLRPSQHFDVGQRCFNIVDQHWNNIDSMLKWNKIRRRIFNFARSWYNVSGRRWNNVETMLLAQCCISVVATLLRRQLNWSDKAILL